MELRIPAAQRGLKFFLDEMIWKWLAYPAALLTVHFLVSVLAIVTLALTEALLHVLRLDGKTIPLSGITLGDWRFDLKVIAASVINISGIIEALLILAFNITSYCVSRVREIRINDNLGTRQ